MRSLDPALFICGILRNPHANRINDLIDNCSHRSDGIADDEIRLQDRPDWFPQLGHENHKVDDRGSSPFNYLVLRFVTTYLKTHSYNVCGENLLTVHLVYGF